MTKQPLNLWFAGTPEFASYSLQSLMNHSDYQVSAVLTQPDRPAGRGRKLKTSAVKNTALSHDISLAQPEKLSRDDIPFGDHPRPDLIIVAAYGLLLPQWFLDYPRLGCINIHASLLPRWRGAAPIQRAIEAGDTETGISIMQMDAGLDTGAVWLTKTTPITPSTDASTLHDTLMELGSTALLEALPIIVAGKELPVAQDDTRATYAHKLNKTEALIDWQEDATVIARKIRAFNTFPVSYTQLNGLRIRVYEAEVLADTHKRPPGYIINHDKNGLAVAAGTGIIRIHKLQMPSKPITTAADLRNGRDLTGHIFS